MYRVVHGFYFTTWDTCNHLPCFFMFQGTFKNLGGLKNNVWKTFIFLDTLTNQYPTLQKLSCAVHLLFVLLFVYLVPYPS